MYKLWVVSNIELTLAKMIDILLKRKDCIKQIYKKRYPKSQTYEKKVKNQVNEKKEKSQVYAITHVDKKTNYTIKEVY